MESSPHPAGQRTAAELRELLIALSKAMGREVEMLLDRHDAPRAVA